MAENSVSASGGVVRMERIDLNEEKRLADSSEHSSKGDQPKWLVGEYWYKADHMGGEALSEIVVSELLKYSNLCDFVSYTPVMIEYGDRELRGCASRNFRGKNETLIPFERLHRAYKGIGLAEALKNFTDTTERIRYTVDFVEKTTGLKNVGEYLTTILELDAIMLNEDRHTNNLAVVRNEDTKEYRLCPIFDNGLSLLSDWNDYPVDRDIYDCIEKVRAKPFAYTFDEQVECAEALYGYQLKFHFAHRDVEQIVDRLNTFYENETLERLKRIIREQSRKYAYYFE